MPRAFGAFRTASSLFLRAFGGLSRSPAVWTSSGTASDRFGFRTAGRPLCRGEVSFGIERPGLSLTSCSSCSSFGEQTGEKLERRPCWAAAAQEREETPASGRTRRTASKAASSRPSAQAQFERPQTPPKTVQITAETRRAGRKY